jgi:proline iminopeptidase
MHVREHTVGVPLDWSNPRGHITVFAREVVDLVRRDEDLPLLLFLQGGSGGKPPRPVEPSGWIGKALKTYRVMLMDQRGTGRSTPASGRRMSSLSAEEGADCLACFRADSIIADAEHLRTTVFGAQVVHAGPELRRLPSPSPISPRRPSR